MSRQFKPNARDNNSSDEDDGGAPAVPPNRDGFGSVFQTSVGSGIDFLVDDGMIPPGGTGLPASAAGLTQSRAPHGREAAGTTKSLLMEQGPEAAREFRSVSMMPSSSMMPVSMLPDPFENLHPATASAAKSLPPQGITVDVEQDGFKFTKAANVTSPEIMDRFGGMLDDPYGSVGPTIQTRAPKQEQINLPSPWQKPEPQRKPQEEKPRIKITLTLEQQAQLIPNPTKATFTPPSLSGMEISMSGWGPTGSCFVRYLPGIYPNRAKLIEDCAFSLESLQEKTRQIQIYNKTLGYQVVYQERPLRATIQTPNCGEFIADFWVSSNKPEFYLALYAQREVGIETQVQMDLLLQALKEETIADMSLPTRGQFNSKNLERLEEYLDSSVQAMEAKSAKTGRTPVTAFQRNVLAEIHDGLLSDSWERRKLAMSLLLHGTDLKSTLGSFACRVASVVLAGASLDQAELDNQRALAIHKTLIHILQEAEFVGDDVLLQDFNVPMDTDDSDGFHSNLTRKRPRFYEDYMSDLHNMAMTILVQALEVAVCFEQHKDLIQQFVANYYLTDNNAMNTVLERCIFQVTDPLARHSLSKGYLACRALRILAESNPELRKQVGLDDKTKSSILGALEVGESSHWLLHRESKDLHNLIYGQMLA